ncbi:hypothetical protein L7F22_007635 [Adiantum nelumboides]|nr:hypothetical protein [Adiantum nelumboides]
MATKFPAEQQQEQPGREHEMQPEFVRPNYKPADKLVGKVAIVTGGDSGIGRSVACSFALEGNSCYNIFFVGEWCFCQLLEGKPSSKKKGHVQHERSPSREREESESSDESMEDVAPRRRIAQRSTTPTKRKRSPHSPHRREFKREEKNSKKKERKRSPSSPSSSPSSSLDEGSGYSSQERQRRGHRRSYAAWKRSSKLRKFKEGGKNISFLIYDGTFGATDKVLAFIQQFDALFGDEGFTESSKLRHVAMHFQKSARQWWASLRANGEAPKTWKALRASIMKQFLASDAMDKVLTEWRSLKLSPYESIHKYVNKFWDLHLKATVYKKIDFDEQKQQFCAGLPEDMNEYVNSQRPRCFSGYPSYYGGRQDQLPTRG